MINRISEELCLMFKESEFFFHRVCSSEGHLVQSIQSHPTVYMGQKGNVFFQQLDIS